MTDVSGTAASYDAVPESAAGSADVAMGPPSTSVADAIKVAYPSILSRAGARVPVPRLPVLRLGFVWRVFQSLAFRALRRAVARAFGVLVRLAISASVALGLGIGSAWYMIDVGSPLTVAAKGSWRIWPAAGRPDADPYTRAHFARLGWLPLATSEMLTLVATGDNEGQRLYADCEYDITGPLIDAEWWSVAVYDSRGMLLDVPAERHGLSRATVVPDGTARASIRLAADARPGNWLPMLGGSAISLVLRIQRPTVQPGQSDPNAERPLPVLPEIVRVSCR
jgi:hypothetical protein